jgi:hypothetical protein
MVNQPGAPVHLLPAAEICRILRCSRNTGVLLELRPARVESVHCAVGSAPDTR